MLAHYERVRIFTKKALAIVGVGDNIVAVRHDLPHMPSLGVSSLDSRPPWRHVGLLFCRLRPRQSHRRTPRGTEALLSRPGPGGCFAPTIPQGLSRQTNEAAADALLAERRRAVEYFSP